MMRSPRHGNALAGLAPGFPPALSTASFFPTLLHQRGASPMAAKDILFDRHGRKRIANGLNTLANAVKVTLGPRGRNVVIEKSWGAPTITKDGVTVAKE